MLDQEGIARGHTAYYLRWASEALKEAGDEFAAQGQGTLAELSDAARKFRSSALSDMAAARSQYAAFKFVGATFRAQRAFRKAAAYRDLALGVPRGTTELQQGTKLQGAEACPSAAG